MDSKTVEPKFKFYPSDTPNFPHGIDIEVLAAVGQTFLENNDIFQEQCKNSPVTIQIRLKLTEAKNAKTIIDLVKGLIAMVKMNEELLDQGKIREIMSILKLDFTSDDNFVYIMFGLPQDMFNFMLKDLILPYHDENNEHQSKAYIISNYIGTSKIKIAAELEPICLLTTKAKDIINTCFNYSFEGFSDNQLTFYANWYAKEWDFQGYDFSIDIVAKEIEKPIYDFCKEISKNKLFEFEKTYKSSDFKIIIYEYNNNFENLKENISQLNSSDDDDSFIYSFLEFQEFVKSSISYLQGQSKGFFKPYFNIISCVDFNQFNISVCDNEKVALISFDVKTKGITEFLVDNFINNK